jgi:hypothetical protein
MVRQPIKTSTPSWLRRLAETGAAKRSVPPDDETAERTAAEADEETDGEAAPEADDEDGTEADSAADWSVDWSQVVAKRGPDRSAEPGAADAAVDDRAGDGTDADEERLRTDVGAPAPAPFPPPTGRDAEREAETTRLDRIQRAIPVEVISVWLMIQGVVDLYPGLVSTPVYWAIFAAVLVATPPYVYRDIDKSTVTGEEELSGVVAQTVIATLAFVVWAYYLGGPFELSGLYNTAYAAILVVLFPLLPTVVSGYVQGVVWVARAWVPGIGRQRPHA